MRRALGLQPSRTAVVAALLAAAYCALRLSLLWRLPVFYDEGQYAAEAQVAFDHPTRETLLLAIRDRHGPLQSLFALGPIALGVQAITSVRLLSVVAGAGGAIACADIAHSLAGRRAAVIAAGLWIVLPFTLVYDSLGLGDSVVAAAMAGAMALAIRLAQRPSTARGALLGVVVAIGTLAKQSAELALIVVPLAVLVSDWRAPDRVRRALRLGVACALAVVVAVAATLVPHLAPVPLQIRGALAGAQQIHPLSEVLSNYAVLARNNAPGFDAALTGYFGVPFLVLAAAGAGLILVRRHAAGLVVVTGLLVPAMVVYAIATTPYPRYLSVVVPALIVLAAITLAAMRPLLAVPLAIVALVAPVITTLEVVASPADAPYPSLDAPQLVSLWPAGTPWPRIADALESHTKKGQDVTVAYDGLGFPPFGLAAVLGSPHFKTDGQGHTVPADLVSAAARGRSFDFRRYVPGTAPAFILEQPDSGAGSNWRRAGYAPVARAGRPDHGPTVTLWRRSVRRS